MPRNELVQSVLRAVEILNCTARSQDGMSLTDLSKLLHLKSSTLHNLARTLTATGYLQRSEAPVRYHLGPELLRIAASYSEHSLLQRTRPILQCFCREHGAVLASLAECHSGDIVQVLRVDENAPGMVQEPASRALHPYGSGSALVFQAFWNSQDRDQYRSKNSFSLFGAHFWSGLNQLESFLYQVRTTGYAVAPIKDEKIVRISVPIFDTSARIKAVLTCGFVHLDGNREKMITLMKDKSASLSGRSVELSME